MHYLLITGGSTTTINSWMNVAANYNSNRPPTILPVEFTQFKASLAGHQTVLVTWETRSERNSDYFIVERSQNLSGWDFVGKQPAAGNSQNECHYQLADYSIPTGDLYYRLKQVDFDGAAYYSKVEHVKTYEDELSVSVFPEAIEVSGNFERGSALLILDVQGKILLQTILSKNNKQRIPYSGLPPGNYFLRLINKHVVQNKRIILNP